MVRKFLAAALLAASISIAPAFADDASPAPSVTHAAVAQFQTEAAAQASCPSDTVVWLNTKSGVWHLKGNKYYGNTKHGAYVCENAARAAGDHQAKSGK